VTGADCPSPTDDELTGALGTRKGRSPTVISREPFAYATSAPLERVVCRWADGCEMRLILKHLAAARRIGQARAKPNRLDDPRREPLMYRDVLTPMGLGPAWRAMDIAGDQPWLALDEVDGIPLWQSGDLDVWRHAVRRLAAWHRSGALAQASRVPLVRWERDLLVSTYTSAITSLERSSDPRASRLRGQLADGMWLVDALLEQPTTLVHGEAFASNLLVTTDDIVPIDWELAAVGPPYLDLAAMTAGWEPASRNRLIAAYGEATGTAVDRRQLAVCRAHLALVYLGWALSWSAPVEHRSDWIGEALDALTVAGPR
jgi:hypothetical protein